MSTYSCIYEGVVVHRRNEPVDRTFRYRLYMMYVDLDELPQLFKHRWLWSCNQPNVAWFRRGDYMDRTTGSLANSVRALVTSQTGRCLTGPVRLLTQFRNFGYVFNPLSLYYCFDENNQLAVIVAEVSNTPWGDRHCYVLNCPSGELLAPHFEISTKKQLHVSPFLHMDYDYLFRLTAPGAKLHVQIANWPRCDKKNGPTFVAELSLNRREITGANLSRVLISHSLMPHRVIAAIYWQAFKLWWQRIPFVPRPCAPGEDFLGQPYAESRVIESDEVNVER